MKYLHGEGTIFSYFSLFCLGCAYSFSTSANTNIVFLIDYYLKSRSTEEHFKQLALNSQPDQEH